MFTMNQDRMIWKAALHGFKILRSQGMLNDARSVLLVWNTASGRRSLIPPALMPDAEVAVVDRVSLISSRWNLGERLCPELGV